MISGITVQVISNTLLCVAVFCGTPRPPPIDDREVRHARDDQEEEQARR